MRTKYFFIYIALGVAFLAASLWVILTAGKNAKAIGAKYKLGGLMLTAWAMLSASTCNGTGPGVVTCYDPVPPEQPMCYDVAVPINKVILESNTVKRGENFIVSIEEPYAERFEATIKDASDNVLQNAVLIVVENTPWQFYFKADENLPTGKAVLTVDAVLKDGDGKEEAQTVFSDQVTIE